MSTLLVLCCSKGILEHVAQRLNACTNHPIMLGHIKKSCYMLCGKLNHAQPVRFVQMCCTVSAPRLKPFCAACWCTITGCLSGT